MSDKMRKEFEDWSAAHYYLGGCQVDVEDGEYNDPDMQCAWESWQASRESLVIDLPAGSSLMGRMYGAEGGGVPLIERSIAAQAIEAAGLKVAP